MHTRRCNMENTAPMKIIGHIRTEFPSKFGIPRQSGLCDTLGEIIFLPEYRNPDALRGISDYSHLWLLWLFHKAVRDDWSPTVRPPRLGGNTRMGVFATRSPFRPNNIGLSSVRLLEVRHTANHGDVLLVSGADLMDGTPILDIKPYLPYTDAHPDASGGFAEEVRSYHLNVDIPKHTASILTAEQLSALRSVLSEDPRPSYQDDPDRIYGFPFSGFEVRFTVSGGTAHVVSIERT